MMDMKERKYVRLRSDMYEDTKFKIIDTKPERDTIHYIWTRFLALAAKVNLFGNLFMSRNIPYTIETLAIEFNRSEEQIKLAIDVFLELEMIELVDGRIYKVKNFAKHQNIKGEEKAKSEVKDINAKNIEATTDKIIINETCDKEDEKSEIQEEDKDKESKNDAAKNQGKTAISEEKRVLDINNIGINKDSTLSGEISKNIVNNSITTIPLERKKHKKIMKNKNKEQVSNLTDEEEEDEEMFCFKEGEYIPGEGETVIASWSF
jgi:phage replisome organizer, putative, N-terminal region